MGAIELSTPVVFIFFNRLGPANAVFAEICKARPKQLFLISDGPREHREGEEQVVSDVRSRILEQVDWPCDVQTNFAQQNMGCKRRIISGLEWVFSCVESAIILEDDCLPEPSFFRYCHEMLDRYREDTRVMYVSGTNFFPDMAFKASYSFSCCASLWGWATWRRAWNLYDGEMKDLPEIRDAGGFKFALSEAMEQEQLRNFEAALGGAVDTWDYQWMYSVYVNSGLGIVPDRNLIDNIGFHSEATHTKFEKPDTIPSGIRPMDFPLVHPAHVLRDYAYDTRYMDVFTRVNRIQEIKSRIPKRIKDPIKKLLGRTP